MANEYEFDDDYETDDAENEKEGEDERFLTSEKKKRINARNRIELLIEKKRLRSMIDTNDSYWDDD